MKSVLRATHFSLSAIEENRFLGALQNNVPFQRARNGSLSRDQCAAPRRLNEIQNIIVRVRRFLRKINPRHQPQQQSSRKYGHSNVRRLHLSIWTWNRPRLYRGELEFAILINPDAAVALKTRLDRLVLVVFRMRIFAVAICLPDFKHCVRNRLAVAIKHAACYGYVFPRDPRSYQVDFPQSRETDREKGPNGLGCSRLQAHLISPLVLRRARGE